MGPFEIDLDQDTRVALLVVRGDLTRRTAPALSGAIAALVARDGYDVVVDLTESGTVLAGTIRALRRGCELASSQHRSVCVACPPSSPVRPALEVAHLDVAVYDTRDEALAHASPGSV